MRQEIHLVGLNHKSAGVEVREAFALSEAALRECGALPDPERAGVLPPVFWDAPNEVVRECMVLSTCNRVEILFTAEGDPQEARRAVLQAWATAKGRPVSDLEPYIYSHSSRAAVEHLFTVASSLDSMVVGEPQILGQLKDAYKDSLTRSNTGAILNKLLHRAFYVAKRVRTETGVASSAVSISYAAVELAKRIFGDMSGYRAMLIGAGEMAELAARHLMNAGVKSIWVSNRTFERAVELAGEFKGAAVPFEDLCNTLPEVDIVISSTGSPEPIIRARDIKEVLKRRKNQPMFFIDIAVPRDIDPDVNSLDNIYLYDIDDLKEVVEENLSQRKDEAVKARCIVDAEAEAFCRWQASLDLQPTIVDLLRRSETIAEEELARTLKRLGPVTPEQEEALRAMLGSVIKKMNHAPISFLKRRFAELIHVGSSPTMSARLASQDLMKEDVARFRRIFALEYDEPRNGNDSDDQSSHT